MNKILCPICHMDRIKASFKKDGYDLYTCSDCTLLFVWPTSVDLKDIYSDKYFNNDRTDHNFGYVSYDEDKKSMIDTFNLYLDKIEKKVSGRNIFDVGAATGYFLDLAKKRGWYTSGVDISEYAANEATKRGHHVFAGNNLDNLNLTNKFDAVTMWDVLEHLPDPVDYLKQVNRIMNIDSILAVNTVNRKSLWARFWGKRWQMIIPPEHLFFYSPNNLSKLFEQNGFEIVETKVLGKKFSLSYIFNILYNWQKIKFYEKLSIYFSRGIWKKISLPINLRDNIFIIVKKTKDV